MPAGEALRRHPQVEIITQRILDGVSCYEIARDTDPFVSHVAVQNFKRFYVLPALKNAQRLEAIEAARRSTNSEIGSTNGPVVGNALPDLFHGDGTLQDAEASDLVREAFGAGVVLAARNRRLAELQAVSDALDEVRDSRAEDLTDRAPGGHTGLLVERVKAAGVEYLLDKHWIDAKLEISRRIAEETGQWQDQGHANVQVNIVIPGGAGASAATIDVQPAGIALPVRKGG